MKKKSVSIFVPVYNEESILKNSISQILRAAASTKRDFEIFIVDDGSKDKTQNVGRELAKNSKVRYIRFEKGPTRRENLAKCFRYATKEIIAFMDADLSADLKYLKRLLDEIDSGNDIAIGSRYRGISSRRGFKRFFISSLYNFFMRLYFNSNIMDHQCGFKAFDRKVLFILLESMGYDKSMRRGWFWDAEILIRAQRKKYRIAEFAVKWNRSQKSTFNFKQELKMISYLIRLRKELG